MEQRTMLRHPTPNQLALRQSLTGLNHFPQPWPQTVSGGQPERCTPKHLFSPKLAHCSRCPAWSPSCPASRRSCALRKEAGKVLQSLALSAASKNKSKYPSNNLLEVEGGFAPATNFIASQTVEGFWSWPVRSGEKSLCAPCYLTLLKGNFSVLGNTLTSHLWLVDKCTCPTVFTEYMW